MRRNYALTNYPLKFPPAMDINTNEKQQFVSTKNMAKYIGTVHIETAINAGAIRHQIKQLTLEQLNQLANEFDCTNINLTLQDSIIKGDGKVEGEGDFLDQFGYALVLRSMAGEDLFTNLRNILKKLSEQGE